MNTTTMMLLLITATCALSLSQIPPRGPTRLGKRIPYYPKSVFHYGFMNRLVETLEKLRQKRYVCPISPLDFTDGVEPEGPRCDSFADCLGIRGSLCCYWSSSDTSHCLPGISKAPKPGDCPTPKFQPIAAGAASCNYDRECGDDDKCCSILNSGDKQCVNPRRDLACPNNLTLHPNGTGVEICTTDSDCSITEMCCGQGDIKYCHQGTDITPKFGQCPKTTPADICDEVNSGCDYDSECEGEKRCCTSGCEYNQCVDPYIEKSTAEIPPPSFPNYYFV